MSETENKKTPLLRFKSYKKTWKQCRLGEICDRITRKNTNLESTLPLTISAQYGLIAQNDFFNKQIASRDMGGYYLVQNGEFAYNKSYSKGYPWGAVKRLDKYAEGVLSTLYIVFKPKKVRSSYLAAYYDSFKWHREVSARAAEGARNHGLLNIAPQDFFETQLFVPTKEEEQEKIGSLFEQINDMIGLYERELELLQLEKRMLLSKTFPKEWNSVPHIRFKEFNDDWSQRKLGEVCEISSGVMGDSSLTDGHYRLTRIETIADGTVNEKKIGYTNVKPDEMYLLKKGDILYSNINSITHMGKVAQYQGGSELYHGINLLRLSSYKGISSEFLLYLLNTEERRNWARSHANQAVSQASINQTLLESQPLTTCSINEQYKIGEYFRAFDHLITLHQRKLETIRELKKTLLKYMLI